MRFTVKYDKVFISGHLQDVNLTCGWECPDYDHMINDLRELKAKWVRNAIMQDPISKDEYIIINVKAEIFYDEK